MNTFHPRGGSIFLLKPNVPSGSVYDDILGLRLDYLNKFNANVNCLIRQKNKCIGKFGSVMQSPAMEWFLQVWISLYDSFIICNPVGTRWTSTPWF